MTFLKMENRVQETLLYPNKFNGISRKRSFGQAFGLHIVTFPERDFHFQNIDFSNWKSHFSGYRKSRPGNIAISKYI